MQQRPCLFFPMFVCLALAEWLVPCQGFVIVFTMVVFPKVFTESSCGTWGLGDPAHLASPISCHYPRRRCSSHPESALISPHLPDSLWPLGLVDAASSAWSSFSLITLGPWLWFYPLPEAFLGNTRLCDLLVFTMINCLLFCFSLDSKASWGWELS